MKTKQIADNAHEVLSKSCSSEDSSHAMMGKLLYSATSGLRLLDSNWHLHRVLIVIHIFLMPGLVHSWRLLVLISTWVSTFFIFAACYFPLKYFFLCFSERQSVMKNLKKKGQAPKLGHNSNALELKNKNAKIKWSSYAFNVNSKWLCLFNYNEIMY